MAKTTKPQAKKPRNWVAVNAIFMRSAQFKDRKKEQSKRGCRGKITE